MVDILQSLMPARGYIIVLLTLKPRPMSRDINSLKFPHSPISQYKITKQLVLTWTWYLYPLRDSTACNYHKQTLIVEFTTHYPQLPSPAHLSYFSRRFIRKWYVLSEGTKSTRLAENMAVTYLFRLLMWSLTLAFASVVTHACPGFPIWGV